MGPHRQWRAARDRSERGRLKKPTGHGRRGRDAETAACRHLEDHGLRLLARNYRTRRGEIDLIMQDADVIVFVEVRSRRHAGFMHPAFSVDLRKQTRLILAGQHYLQNAGLLDSAMCRFDVVSVTGEVGAGEIEWIRGAFEA